MKKILEVDMVGFEPMTYSLQIHSVNRCATLYHTNTGLLYSFYNLVISRVELDPNTNLFLSHAKQPFRIPNLDTMLVKPFRLLPNLFASLTDRHHACKAFSLVT